MIHVRKILDFWNEQIIRVQMHFGMAEIGQWPNHSVSSSSLITVKYFPHQYIACYKCLTLSISANTGFKEMSHQMGQLPLILVKVREPLYRQLRLPSYCEDLEYVSVQDLNIQDIIRGISMTSNSLIKYRKAVNGLIIIIFLEFYWLNLERS